MNKNIRIVVIVLVIIIIGAFAYYSSKSKPVDNTIPPATTTENSILGCYVVHLAKDVYVLNIQSEANGNIKGVVAYNNFEKDSSSGTFEGTFTNGILLGKYSFLSEGTYSVRQLIFKKDGDNFVEGFGSSKTVDNEEVFENTASVTYDPKSTFVKSANCTEHFTDANNTFSFDYNSFFNAFPGINALGTDWKLDATRKGTLLATMTIPRTYMPKTNFSEVRMTVGRSTDAKEIKSCTTATVNGEVQSGTANISGYPFTKFSQGGAGAGNFYDTTSYRAIVDGDCYAIEYTIHSTNIGNYSPDQGITEFYKTKIVNETEKVISSFKFLISSN